jgi:hypothetical protein
VALPGFDRAAYVLARVFGEGDVFHNRQPERVRNLAITNPVYLRPQGWRMPTPTTTELTLRTASGSPWSGGQIVFEDAVGQEIERGTLRGGQNVRVRLPAAGRFRLQTDTDDPGTIHYLINRNPEVQRLQRYLYRGGFLRDHPSTPIGHVPAEAFRLEEMSHAMARLSLNVESLSANIHHQHPV